MTLYKNFSRPSRFRRKFSRSARFQEFQKTFKMFRISIDSRFKLQYFSIDSSCINHFSHWFFITMPLGSYSSMITLWWQLRPIMSFKWKFLSQWNWIYWNLWVLKSEVLLKGSTEICELRSTEISTVLRFVGLLKYEGLNLEGLLKFGVLKSRGSTEIQKGNQRSQWSIEISRIYWNPKRVFSIYIHSIILGALRASEITFHAFSNKKSLFFRSASRQRAHPAYPRSGLSVAHALRGSKTSTLKIQFFYWKNQKFRFFWNQKFQKHFSPRWKIFFDYIF